MKTRPFHLFILIILTLCMQCECEESPGVEACPEEPHGDFFLALEQIEVPFLCSAADFPDLNTWQSGDIFTDSEAETTKYFVSIRIEGFCDNIGKNRSLYGFIQGSR